jgi:hypothetical protein
VAKYNIKPEKNCEALSLIKTGTSKEMVVVGKICITGEI